MALHVLPRVGVAVLQDALLQVPTGAVRAACQRGAVPTLADDPLAAAALVDLAVTVLCAPPGSERGTAVAGQGAAGEGDDEGRSQTGHAPRTLGARSQGNALVLLAHLVEGVPLTMPVCQQRPGCGALAQFWARTAGRGAGPVAFAPVLAPVAAVLPRLTAAELRSVAPLLMGLSRSLTAAVVGHRTADPAFWMALDDQVVAVQRWDPLRAKLALAMSAHPAAFTDPACRALLEDVARDADPRARTASGAEAAWTVFRRLLPHHPLAQAVERLLTRLPAPHWPVRPPAAVCDQLVEGVVDGLAALDWAHADAETLLPLLSAEHPQVREFAVLVLRLVGEATPPTAMAAPAPVAAAPAPAARRRHP